MAETPTDPITTNEMAKLIEETGQRHHEAYISADGNDPEWAIWYAGYMQSHLFDRLPSLPARSQLVHLLFVAEADHAASSGETPWATHYAGTILTRLGAEG